jgi:hypothetical protein
MCTFKHALVQEAAYDSLLKRTRQQLHSRVADVLMAEFPERAAAEPEVVAGHEELARRTPEAIAAYQRAGEKAQARSAHAEAIRHLRHAISLLKTEPEGGEGDVREIPLQLALGRSLGGCAGLYPPKSRLLTNERAFSAKPRAMPVSLVLLSTAWRYSVPMARSSSAPACWALACWR